MSNEKQVPQLAPGMDNLIALEQVSTVYDAKIPVGVAPETLLQPAFWAHHGIRLKPMDEIRARAEDGTWLARLVVLDSSRNWAKVQMLHHYKLTTADVSLSQASEEDVRAFVAKHKVVHRGPHKWSVVRTHDAAVLHEGEQERAQAVAWLDAHARVNAMGVAEAKAKTAEAVT